MVTETIAPASLAIDLTDELSDRQRNMYAYRVFIIAKYAHCQRIYLVFRYRSWYRDDNLVRGPPRATKPPPTVFCYICGRQFGSRSIEIHIPQCLKKWELQNERLPKSQRRPPPPRPDIAQQGEAVDMYRVNDAAWAASQAALVPCANCGRTFNPDRLVVHQRSCTKDRPAKQVGAKISSTHSNR